MPSPHAPGLFDGPYDNRSLFSDHFLTERLPETSDWESEMNEAREKIKRIYDGAKGNLVDANEAQTERDFIKPVFEALDWHYDVQQPTQQQGRHQVPDYALFTSEKACAEARSMRGDPDAYEARMAAVADAKFWGRPLDAEAGAGGRETLTNANPSFQIVNYMTATNREWGLLTNGKRWRLYYAGARSRIDTYYEANLHHLLEASDQEEAFRWFWLFFRAGAFRPDPAHGGQTFLESVYRESESYAADLEDRLKALVFEEVFPLLAEGFTDDLGTPNPKPETLNRIYHGTLRLLYRLLFLLHAEARDLLPVRERGYQSYSLTSIKEEVTGKIDERDVLSSVSTDLWNDLRGLFRIIDRGDPDLNVPRYNGGLFSSANPANDFFERRAVADKYLAPALDRLARTANPDRAGGRDFVDYKALDVQQLGSIYEGLLEFRLAMDGGELVLETDKGERKATGSYYTPHYVVEYITESALGAVLDEREDRFRRAMEKIEALREKHAASGPGLRAKLKPLEAEAANALLGLTVCDPAMGSGHFLVHAVDYLTERIAALLGEYPQNPIKERLDAIRRDLLADLGEQGVDIDAGRLKDTNLLKRLVMKRCIYGVDLNPMAVELAKLSLWLDSFTLGAPLSFLDHHLRCGNALIGARVEAVREDLKAQQGQGEIFGGPFAGLLTATRFMQKVAENTDATPAEVEESAERFDHYQEAVAPYERLLDLYTSEHFANRRARYLLQQFGPQMLDLFKGKTRPADERQEQTVEAARAVAEEKRFFHWELEFPEVFFDLRRSTWKENPGFDAVIGNPPYEEPSESERGEELPELNYFESVERYEKAVGYRLNLYRLFVVRALEMAKIRGRHSFIVPLSLLGDKFAHGIREKVLEETQMRIVERFPQKDDTNDRVFPEAKLSTCIYVLENRSPSQEKVLVRSHPGRDIEENSPTFKTQQENFFEFDKANASIPGLSQQAWDLVLRLGAGEKFTELGRFAKTWRGEIMINRSFEPYSTNPEDGEEIIRGSHIGLYQLVDPKQGEALYLNREKYLADHGDSETAFHHQNERIVYQRYAAIDNYRRLIAAILPEGNFCSHTVGYVTDDSHYSLRFLLSVLNSTLLDWRFNLTSTNNNINGYEVESLPIREITFETPEAEREAAVEEAVAAYEEAVEGDELLPWTGEVSRSDGGVDPPVRSHSSTTPESPPVQEGSFSAVLDAVDDHLNAEPERADVVHDLLAHLARQMTRLHAERQRLDAALDPFKFLDRGAPFVPFAEAFDDAIKYGTPLREAVDPGAVHHDLDGLRLTPTGGGSSAWTLEVQLKKRDPDAGWRDWQKDGSRIARAWAPVYRFPERGLPEGRARYYQHAFRVIGDFVEAGSFPGGYTRTTQKKLHAAGVPRFDAGADLAPLVELSEEHAEVEGKIAFTDDLIDRIVYRLYDLTDEEVALVEE